MTTIIPSDILKDKDNKYYTKYKVNNDTYEPIGTTANMLPSGYYTPLYDSYYDKVVFVKKEVIIPKLYVLPNEIQTTILDDIKKFWKSEERYRKFGNVYKRNILLYSQPGNGKTSLINILSKILIEEYNGVIICIETAQDLESYFHCMKRFRIVEPNRKVITILEDFEAFMDNKQQTSKLLQMLDGNSQLDNVVTIATTNHPELIENRFTCRPSRFNIVIEYKKPNDDIRKAYIENKLKDVGIDLVPETDNIKRLVERTKGYTFDFLKEVVQGIYVDMIDEDTIFKRLNGILSKNGQIKIEEQQHKAIGFSDSSPLSNSVEEDIEIAQDLPNASSSKRKIGFQSITPPSFADRKGLD